MLSMRDQRAFGNRESTGDGRGTAILRMQMMALKTSDPHQRVASDVLNARSEA